MDFSNSQVGGDDRQKNGGRSGSAMTAEHKVYVTYGYKPVNVDREVSAPQGFLALLQMTSKMGVPDAKYLMDLFASRKLSLVPSEMHMDKGDVKPMAALVVAENTLAKSVRVAVMVEEDQFKIDDLAKIMAARPEVVFLMIGGMASAIRGFGLAGVKLLSVEGDGKKFDFSQRLGETITFTPFYRSERDYRKSEKRDRKRK